MPEQGFLVISDITGYSTYLHESELEHAQESLTDLLNLLIKHARSPLVISKLEGDAVFSYSPQGGFKSGQTLLEMIEVTYAAFRKALDLMVINTTCTCNACRNLPNLDLKFFIHYGEYSIQQLGDFQELVGNDVNLVHRMLKNTITEVTGLKAYAAYTQAVIDALDMSALVAGMSTHNQTLADVGEVQLYVQDMHGVWERRKDQLRIVITKKEAIAIYECEFPIPPPLLWDYITKPKYRKLLLNSDSQSLTGQTEGRIGTGAVYVCAHGDTNVVQKIVDWQPFEQYTIVEVTAIGKATHNNTFKIESTAQGSRLLCLFGKHNASWIVRHTIDFLMPFIMPGMMKKGEIRLREKIEQDLAAGSTVTPQKIIFGNEMASKAAAQSLVENASS